MVDSIGPFFFKYKRRQQFYNNLMVVGYAHTINVYVVRILCSVTVLYDEKECKYLRNIFRKKIEIHSFHS